jgi:hypothetical protein
MFYLTFWAVVSGLIAALLALNGPTITKSRPEGGAGGHFPVVYKKL